MMSDIPKAPLAVVPLIVQRVQLPEFAGCVAEKVGVKLPQFPNHYAFVLNYEEKLILENYVILLVRVEQFVDLVHWVE